MDITCKNCQGRFRIPDDKITHGKAFFIKCPKCNDKISIETPEQQEVQEGADQSDEPIKDALDRVITESLGTSDKPFDFAEEEGKTALVCETSSVVKEKVGKILKLMEFSMTEAEDARDALKKMRYRTFDLILVNENFDTDNPDSNGVIIYLEHMNMDVRRDIFVSMITNRYQTQDNFTALSRSVNIVINEKDIGKFDKLLSRAIADTDLFYHLFKDTIAV